MYRARSVLGSSGGLRVMEGFARSPKGTGDSYLHVILTDEEGRTILYLEWCVV